MNNTKPGMADYMLAVMNQILGSAAVEKEVSETEKVRIREINEVTVTERYMTIENGRLTHDALHRRGDAWRNSWSSGNVPLHSSKQS